MSREAELEKIVANLELEIKLVRERNDILKQELLEAKEMVNKALLYVEGIKNGRH